MATTTLYRPVGQQELDRIREADWREFPPRLPHQPIFYPVLTRAYAEKIAREWNTCDSASGYVGYVTEFEVETVYLARYDVQRVGGAEHLEYWIPAADLAEFHRHLVGTIRVVAEYRGTGVSS